MAEKNIIRGKKHMILINENLLSVILLHVFHYNLTFPIVTACISKEFHMTRSNLCNSLKADNKQGE